MESIAANRPELVGQITPDQIQIHTAPVTQLALESIDPATTVGTVVDATGVYHVSRRDGRRYLEYTGKGGNTFEGEVETPQEQAKVPTEILDKIRSVLKKSDRGGKPLGQ